MNSQQYTYTGGYPDATWATSFRDEPTYRLARNVNARIMAAASLALVNFAASASGAVPRESFSQSQASDSAFVDDKALLFSEIIQKTELARGWDGSEDDRAPSESAANDAITFLEKMPAGFELPEVFASSDGELGLFWETGEAFINVSFFGDGKAAFYATRDGVSHKAVFEMNLGAKIPPALATALSELV